MQITDKPIDTKPWLFAMAIIATFALAIIAACMCNITQTLWDLLAEFSHIRVELIVIPK